MPTPARSAKLGLGGTLIVQVGATGLLFAPFAPSLWVWGIAVFCGIGGWLALWTMLYIMAKQP